MGTASDARQSNAARHWRATRRRVIYGTIGLFGFALAPLAMAPAINMAAGDMPFFGGGTGTLFATLILPLFLGIYARALVRGQNITDARYDMDEDA